MAIAAALTGGIAMERELTETHQQSSTAAGRLRTSLRLLGTGAEADVEAGHNRGHASEATLVRRHTAHSVFMNLADELKERGALKEDRPLDELHVGDLVAFDMEPAIAPLRRVIDQVLRLLDVMSPVLGLEEPNKPPPRGPKKQGRQSPQPARAGDDPTDGLAALRALFVALRDDLDRSGMVDVVVAPEDGLKAVLTLNKLYADDTALEMLHTSSFRVIGKVTRVWRDDDDVVSLYRRSALSLIPALSGQVMVGVFGLLFAIAQGAGKEDVQEQLNALTGQSPEGGAPPTAQTTDSAPSPSSDDASEDDDDIRIGDDVAALNPALMGPAIQILPLALCV